MKRVCGLILILLLILPMALLPSAFCVAEPENVARFEEVLNTLATYTSYASPQALALIEEAEALLPDPDVQAAYSDDELAYVAFYRHAFHVDCTVAEINAKVKFYRYVRYSVADERNYASREWEAIVDAYTEAVSAIDAATAPEAMEAVRDDFFAEIHALPVYQEVVDAWTPVINEVINAEVARLVDKVNAYRASVGLPARKAPVFLVDTTEDSTEEVSAFATANLVDADNVSLTFSNALGDAILLGFYADKTEMQGVWEAYRYAVDAATAYASPEEIALNNKKNAAVAALRQAIADSAYIQKLTGSDYAVYQELPNVMQRQLAEVEDEEEVDRVLEDYLALLEPDALEKPKSKLNSITIVIIVLACVTVALFVAYFVIRFARGRAPKQDRVGAEQMLEELRRMSDAAVVEGEDNADAPAGETENESVGTEPAENADGYAFTQSDADSAAVEENSSNEDAPAEGDGEEDK